MAQYVAVRQRDGHHVLSVDLQRADGLCRPSVFSLDSKLGDESVDAVRQEPGDHDKRVVLCERRQVGDEARRCMQKYAQICSCVCVYIPVDKWTYMVISLCRSSHGTQRS